jgi:hypothetical protein
LAERLKRTLSIFIERWKYKKRGLKIMPGSCQLWVIVGKPLWWHWA